MKLILSRKGFDSSYGGVPSPILPDGRLLSLPIPSSESPIAYGDLSLPGLSVGAVVESLTKRRILSSEAAHLDPDLSRQMLRRKRGWRPVFGQHGREISHLRKHGVTDGDLFLFFGWFRQTEHFRGQLCYVRGAPHLHVLFGWLQIERTVSVYPLSAHYPQWMTYHPHFYGKRGPSNTVFVSGQYLEMDALRPRLPGAGTFPGFTPDLQLTAPGETRSIWKLPSGFYPANGRPPLSYHGDLTRWERKGERVILKSVARGQEFVLDLDFYPVVMDWLRGILKHAA